MLTRHRSFAILVTVVILAASFTIIGIPSARAADLSLGFSGQGVYPQVATANSQRWFRVHVTYDGTINDDGVPNERITGLYLDRGVVYNNNLALPAAPSGGTYFSELTAAKGLWDAGRRGGVLGTIRLTVVASTTKVYYVTPLSVYYSPGQLTGYTLTITSGLGDTNTYDITDNDVDGGGTYLVLDGATPLDDEVCADLEVVSNPTTTRVYYDPVPAVSYYPDNTLGGMILRFTEGEAAGQEFDIVGNGQNPSGYYIDVSGDTELPAALMQEDDADSIPTTTKFYYSTISFGEAFLVGHTLVITSGTADGDEREISYNGVDGTGTYIITTTNLPAGFAVADTFTIKDIMHVCDTAELENLAAALDQPEYFGVARHTVAGYPDYNVGFTVGPFAGHHYEYLVGRVYTGHTSPTETHELRFSLYWDSWNATDGYYESQDPVRVTATYVTVPLSLPTWLSTYAGVSQVHHSFEQAAWYTGDVGAGVDPLVVTEGEEGTNIDNGSGSANYTFRVAYNSQRSDLPPVWRVTSDRTMPAEDYPYVRLDDYVEQGLRNDDWDDWWRKWSHWDEWYDGHVWIYWEGDDPHYDHLGTQHSGRNPEAILILDDNYDRPFYMERESGSFAGTVVYRYDIRPTNYLQLLNNIFMFAFDTAGPDAWDFCCPLVYNGRPLSNAYVSMRAGGHKYQLITTRDWDPPVWALSHSGPGSSHSQVGPCSVALASRPGDSLTAEHVLYDWANAGTIADPEVVSEDVYEWFDDQGGGGYGYPYDSQLADRYPKVDPVLTAHPYFEEGPLTGPNSVERGYPWGWYLEDDLGPAMPGSLPNPFNPDANTSEPWGALVGPKHPQVANPSSAPVNVLGGYNPGSPLDATATGESPERFTNQGTIWPNYVNIWPDTVPYDPDLSQPSAFRGGKWTTNTNFVFRINYWQSDNLAPGSVQLFVRKVGEDGSPLTSWMGYSLSKVYPADNTYTNGCLYYEELNSVQLPGGGAGDYQYYFRASDGVRAAIYPNRPDDDFGYIGVPPGGNDYYWFRVNNRPTLADQSLTPVSGPQRGDFAWEVTYADQDGEVYDAGHAGDPPFKSILWIDLFGDVEGQAEVNGAPSGNVITYTVPGTAYADSSLVGMEVRMQTGAEAGQQFTITANDQSSSTITATGVGASGIADGDLFNIADWFAGTMDAVSPGDTNYRDGALYDFSTARAGVQLDPGIHHYYFEFWDNWAYWINWQQYFMTSDPDPIDQKVEGQMVRLPAQGYLEGPEIFEEIPPILSSYYFAPPVTDQITAVDVGTDTIEYDRAGDLPGYGTNNVQTMYLEILGGFAQFKVFPILSNTDTEIELNTTSVSMDGVQVGNRFRIYEDRTQDTSTGKWYQSWGYDTDPGSADDYDGTPATPFYFYVLYTDADNNAPQAIRLQIDDDAGQIYEMEKVVPGDINYAAGVLYRTSAQVYMAEGSHTFEAQAWDGASWYNNGDASDFWGPYGYAGSAANGPDIAPNAAPQLSFKVGENLEIASVDPIDPYIFTYTEPTDPDEALGDDPITAVYISAVGHNYSTDSPGGGYVVSSHNPATNTIELADEGLDLSSNVSDTFTAAAELVPRTGFSDDTYRYYVVYTDTDTYGGTTGNPATFVNAYIDAAEYAMAEYDPTDLDVSDGKVYYYDMSSLSPSPAHTYYFMASDGVDNVRFPPAPNYFDGPLVTVNGPPNPPPYPPADGWSPINGVSVDTQTPTLDWPAGSDDDPWDSPSNFTYVVQLSMTADLSTVGHEYDTTDYGGPGVTELDVPDDLDWAWWYWRVQTVDGHGLGSAWSAIHYFKVDQTPQPPGSGFSPASAPAPAGIIGTLTPTLQWDPGTDPDADDPPEDMRYHVQLDDDADFASPIVSPDLGGPGDPEYGVTGVGVTSFQVDISLGLEANTPYHWRVRTVNGLESAWSTTQTFTVVIPTYLLSGTIYDSDSLAVKVREETTLADGEYEFTGLSADTYQVVPVFDPFSFDPVGGDDHATIVDSDITDFDFDLVDGAYKITGTITITGGGGPLEDAVVSIGIRSDDTNASGYYEITGLTTLMLRATMRSPDCPTATTPSRSPRWPGSTTHSRRMAGASRSQFLAVTKPARTLMLTRRLLTSAVPSKTTMITC